MNPELLAKIQGLTNTNIVKINKVAKERLVESKVRKEKLYGSNKVKVIKNKSGKFTAFVPVGMTSNRFVNVCDKYVDALKEFKNNLEQDKIIL